MMVHAENMKAYEEVCGKYGGSMRKYEGICGKYQGYEGIPPTI